MPFKNMIKVLLVCKLTLASHAWTHGATMSIVSKCLDPCFFIEKHMCLGLRGRSTLDGTSIVTEKCASLRDTSEEFAYHSQQWFFDAGSWRIRSLLNPNKCIDWQFRNFTGDLRINSCDANSTSQLFGWDDATHQIFVSPEKGAHAKPVGSMCFKAGNKSADDHHNVTLGTASLAACDVADKLQQWNAIFAPPPPPTKTMAIISKANPHRCLDLLGQAPLDGTAIVTETCVAGLLRQQWFFDAGSWRIRSALDPTKCIDWQVVKGDPKGSLKLNGCDANSTRQLFGWDDTGPIAAIFASPEKGAHWKVGSMCFTSGEQERNHVTLSACNATRGDKLQQWYAIMSQKVLQAAIVV